MRKSRGYKQLAIFVIAITAIAAIGLICRGGHRRKPQISRSHQLCVLFIGNSFTGYNDLPALFAHLARSRGYTPHVEEYIWYGQTLSTQSRRSDLQAAFSTEKWDYVVLQEESNQPLHNFRRFRRDIEIFDRLTQKTGGKTILWEVWAHKGEHNFSEIAEAYERADRKARARIAPLGKAWEIVEKNKKYKIDMFRDSRHPTPIATYLAACIFFRMIYSESPIGLPHDGIDAIPFLFNGQYGGEPSPRAFISLDKSAGADAVNYMQRLAAENLTP